MATVRGLRPYGHGKFQTLIDSYAYGVTLDGGADKEASFEEGGGWYGLLWIDADTIAIISDNLKADYNNEPAKGKLTQAEYDLLNEHAAIIFFERSDGIVDTEWMISEEEAEDRWEEIEEEVYGEEGEDDDDDEEKEER